MQDIAFPCIAFETCEGYIEVERRGPGGDRKVNGNIDRITVIEYPIPGPCHLPPGSALFSVDPSGRGRQDKRDRTRLQMLKREPKTDVQPSTLTLHGNHSRDKSGSSNLEDGRTGRVAFRKQTGRRNRKRNLIDPFLASAKKRVAVGKGHVKEYGIDNAPHKKQDRDTPQDPVNSSGPLTGARMGNAQGVIS